MRTLRIGIIDYLNVMPVYDGILHENCPIPYEPVFGMPSQLNRSIASGEVDIAAISSFEYACRAEQYFVFPHLSVSADGPVHSIYLFSHLPLDQLTGNVGLTSTSATSICLVQYLLRNHTVEFSPLTENPFSTLTAKMLIGDEAIREAQGSAFPYRYDLSALWRQETGYPFVFALWVVRRETFQAQPEAVYAVYEAFLQSRRQAESRYPHLAREYNHDLFPTLEACEQYLRNLCYDLTPPFQQGFLHFQKCCVELGLLKAVSPLEFLPKIAS